MKNIIKSLSCFLILASTLLADQPKSIITGKNSTKAPGVLILDSSGSTYDKAFGANGIWWEVADDSLQVMEGLNGRFAIWYDGNQPLKSKVTLTTWGMVDGVPVPSRQVYPIVFGGELPIPPGPGPLPPLPPGPTPVPPTPTPVVPIEDGKYKLAKLSFDTASQVDPTMRVKVKQIADCFTTTAKAIRDGKFNDALISSALKKAGIANADMMGVVIQGPERKEWEKFNVPVNARVNILANTGQINTLADLAVAFDEIAVGLGNVK